MEEKTKILVADDDAGNLHSLEAVLRSLGYEVILAANGEEALAKVKETLPNVILLDTLMPIIDGFEVVRRVKRGEATKTIPVVMMTARIETEDRLKALAAGADDFLIKPVDETELQTRVKSLLKVKLYDDHILNYQRDLDTEVTRRTQELTKSLDKLKVASLDTVYRLSRACSYKDDVTGAHVERVSHYSSAIARSMKLGDKFVENILWAAPMHDIGKIGIPDRVLMKPDKLDDEEYALIKQHTTIGAELLKDSDADFIKLAAEIALSHHESWGGRGYPRGLKGTDIPLSGRIVAIADVFDVITSDRPYKTAATVEEAFAKLKEENAKGFWDPQVAEAFFSIQSEIKAEHSWWRFMSTGTTSEESDLSNLFK